MTSLWLIFAVLILLAFGFIFWPLTSIFRNKKHSHRVQKQENIAIFHDRLNELELEKEQGSLTPDAFLTLKTELEKTLLHDAQEQDSIYNTVGVSRQHWSIAAVMGIAVAVVSLGMYFDIGRSDDLFISQAMANPIIEQPSRQAQNQGQQPPPSMEKSIALLEAKIQEDPKNKEKLFLLANSYSALGRFAQSATVFAQMADLTAKDSDEYAGLRGAQAQSLFQASNETMTDEILGLIKEAISIDPLEPSSLMLQGINAFSSDKHEQAIGFWNKAKQKAGAMQIKRFIEPAINAAQRELGTPATKKTASTAPTAVIAKTKEATAAPSVTIDLSLSKALKDKVNDNHTVFVFARPVGGRMPLAAERIHVKDLPKRIVLDDTKAAMPTAKLSSVEKVEVTARISLSGNPMPTTGDLYITVKDIIVKDNVTLALEINKIVD
ncbi:MAG: c-type cytochrome biogenesis protein CcmI [Methylococcales bacterium]|nr:c-type cytochrome biogenesis protein CcmI [Methylococcales bacterium]